MPTTRTRSYQALRSALERLRSFAGAIQPKERRTDKEEMVDEQDETNYGEDMADTNKNVRVSFGRAMLASRFGIIPAEVTDEFLDHKIAEASREAKETFSRLERDRGVKLKPTTDAYARAVDEKVRKIIEESRFDP